DVDLSKVLTAGHIAKRAETVQVDKGPRVALRIMKENRLSTVYVVDKQNKLVGAVTAVDASKAIDRNLPLSEVVTKEVKTVSEDTLLTDLFEEVSVASIPVAVVDEQ